MLAFEMGHVPQASVSDFSRPAACAEPQMLEGLDETYPSVACPRRRRNVRQGSDRIGLIRDLIEYALCSGGSDARKQLQNAESCHPIAWVLDETQQGHEVLDVLGVEKLQAAKLHERDITARQFDFEWTAVTGCPEQNGLLFEEGAGLPVLQDAFDDEACLVGLVANGDQLRFCGGSALGRPIADIVVDET